MDRFKFLVLPGCLVAAGLIILPMADTAVGVWPIRMAETTWRFGTVGLFAQVLSSMTMGLLLILAMSMIAESRVMALVTAGLAGFALLVMTAATLTFVMDSLQMRAQAPPQAVTAFYVAVVMALAKYGVAMVVALVIAIAGWRTSRAGQRAAASNRGGATLVRAAPRAAGSPAAP